MAAKFTVIWVRWANTCNIIRYGFIARLWIIAALGIAIFTNGKNVILSYWVVRGRALLPFLEAATKLVLWLSCLASLHQKYMYCTVVQLDFTPEIEIFCMMSDFFLSIFTTPYKKRVLPFPLSVVSEKHKPRAQPDRRPSNAPPGRLEALQWPHETARPSGKAYPSSYHFNVCPPWTLNVYSQ